MDNQQHLNFRPLSVLIGAILALSITACSTTQEKPETSTDTGPEAVVAPVAEETAPVREKIVLKPDYPARYVVQKGDTLWDISERFLRDPWVWPELWRKNPQIENPHLIYPGDVLTLIYVDGQPVMQVQRGTTASTVAVPVSDRPYPTVKLSPRIREVEQERSIPTIRLDQIKAFLNRPRIVGEHELDTAPYIVSSADQHLMAGIDNTIYVRGLERLDGANYTVVRRGQAYRNSEGELLGYEAINVAEARVKMVGDPASMVITESYRETLNGDRLLPAVDDGYNQNFMPRIPSEKMKGQIISVVDGASLIGQYQIVVLDLGREDGIEPGHVLGVKQSGVKVRDRIAGGSVTLPEERAGILMVFRTFDRLSYALVMRATLPIHVKDTVTNP